MHEADMYQHNYILVKEKNDQLLNSAAILKSQYMEVIAERQRLTDDADELRRLHDDDRREIDEMQRLARRRRREDFSDDDDDDDCSDDFDTMYDARYETLKRDYDALRKQYADIVATSSATSARLDAVQKENETLRRQYDGMAQNKERAIVQQHAAATVQSAGRENGRLAQELQSARLDREKTEKQLAQMLADKMKAYKEMTRAKEERNAAVQEYALVMSERDSVHKEIEQLQDTITDMKHKFDVQEKEKKSAFDEAERARRALDSVLDERERQAAATSSRKMTTAGLQEKAYSDGSGSIDFEVEQEKILNDFDSMLRDRGSSFDRLDRDSVSPYVSRQPQEVNVKEMDNLRRDLEKAQAELMGEFNLTIIIMQNLRI